MSLVISNSAPAHPPPLLFTLSWVSCYKGTWWEQWAVAFPSHSPKRLLQSKEPTSRLSTTAPPPPPLPRPPVMWEKPGRVSHWVCSGRRPGLKTYHWSPLSCSIKQARLCSLQKAHFMIVFFTMLFHRGSDQTQTATQVAVGMSKAALHQWLVILCYYLKSSPYTASVWLQSCFPRPDLQFLKPISFLAFLPLL